MSLERRLKRVLRLNVQLEKLKPLRPLRTSSPFVRDDKQELIVNQ